MNMINFGSLNIDKVYNLPHFVSPGETVHSQSYQEYAGGKGLNQSVAASRAGLPVIHAGAVGSDGIFLCDTLKASGVDTAGIQILGETSGHAIIQVNRQGQNCIIVHGGANQMLTEEYIDRMLSSVHAGDIVLLQNETNAVDTIMKKAVKKCCQVAFNPSPVPDHAERLPLDCVRYFILNELEGAVLAGLPADTADGRRILEALTLRFPQAVIVLTLGTDGVLCQMDGQHFHHACFHVDAVDTTAAGDTFCGYFLAGIGKGLSVPDCLRRASAASAIAVSRKGAAPSIPTDREVREFLTTRQEAF